MDGRRGSVESPPPVTVSPLLFRGELQVCILNERIGWRAALHNQQTPTPEDPTGLPAAVDRRAEQTQCQVKTPLLTTHIRHG